MNDEVRLLFRELADLSPGERDKALAERHLSPEMRAEIVSLLSFDSADDHHLTGYISVAAEEALRARDEPEATKCGAYRLIRQLGSGGMGAVYLGERADGEIQQQVAVKLLRSGEERPAWRDRFLTERQLLASLNHPAIARVIDAGHTADGHPYLVMEYVDGVPIDQYAAGKDLRDQLTLFLRVCEAVSHAHRHLIIHRDLKPSNILVDASGQPKLLDFGIAKLLDATGSPTQTVERLLTPNYASPEQLRGASQTTTTDVYSLGAVLYKLLTGRSPHETDKGVIQPIEVMTGTKGIVAPSRLNAKLPGDLDYVLLKALRHEPEERYASVEALANDVRAFLDSRPVQARSGNAWYRTRKWLRRYWVPAIAATVTIAGLSVGLYVANQERMLAEMRFLQVRQLANHLLELDGDIRQLHGATQTRRRIVSTSLEYLEHLGTEVHGDPDLALEIGTAYLQVARVQGVPAYSNLGQLNEAHASLGKAASFVESVLSADPDNRTALMRSVDIAYDRMILAESQQQRREALAQARTAASHLDALTGHRDTAPEELMQAARFYSGLAMRHIDMNLYDDAVSYAHRMAEISTSIGASRPEFAMELTLLHDVLRLAESLKAGNLGEAVRANRNGRSKLETGMKPQGMHLFNLITALWREGWMLGREGGISLQRPEEAIPLLYRALEMAEDVAREDPTDYQSRDLIAAAGGELGDILGQRDPPRALAVYDRALLRLREIKDNVKARRDEARILAASSYALRRLRRNGEAKQRIETALALLRGTKDFPADQVVLGSEAATALRALADHHAAIGQPQQAAAIYRELLGKVMASQPNPHTDLHHANHLSRIYQALGSLYRRTGQREKAVEVDALRLALWQHWDGKLPNNSFVQRQLAAVTAK
jgi:tetratricopeptide (TPR) repeat protein/predicted Ser/Thr protein kinase